MNALADRWADPRAERLGGQPRLQIRHLSKCYPGGVTANDDVNLSLSAGTVGALLGPNGAGKTTLVNTVIGLLAPSSGTITIDGHDVVADDHAARRLCSFQPQAQMSFDGLTSRKAIELVGRLRGGKRSVVRQRTDSLIEALDMTKWAKVDGARLSGGLKRLTGFAMAAVVPGRLVLLDEPTNDVDPIRRRLLWAQVRAMADEGSTVLVVTHNLDEVESICDRFIVMGQGKIVGDTSPGSIPDASGALQIVLTVRRERGAPGPTLRNHEPHHLEREGHRGREGARNAGGHRMG